MADNEDGEERTSRGNEWEVVTLTASAYEAAPRSGQVELKDDDKGDASMQDEAETSHALFMSRHFVFPPIEHENLPLEPDYSEILGESGGKDISEVIVDDGARPSGKDEDSVMISEMNVSEAFSDIPFLDDKMSKFSVHGKQFAEGTTLEDLGLIGKEESMYDTAKYNSLHSETDFGDATAYGDNIVVSEAVEPAEQESNTSLDLSDSKNFPSDYKCHPSDLPCEAWWKRRAAALYAHAKEANAYWSIFIAAAVMGLVMLGQRWQQERSYQLQLHGGVNDEGRSRILAPIIRLKDVIVGGHRRGSLIRGSSDGS
ncbi:ATG8-interacting protein 1-like [Neltuma alba]|uniref:ATG8-interacting protein 1 n=1 Tax=Neltuma alba TaxID=207710 RepID=UPI0010A479DB|nr:ATG8-interacting protein 1-like [Prosopis alba]XP_028769270.1 ATG8-interacting protein 1-like [Prosopis alba]XP_028769271.1 ATG8-interacting protein 1-like [Prosopis alba]XP_028791723.1 ATG8-interacting protein 1-like [Prosopis alba]XP_028791725.1 ATG8-interacting protein 1-like [Prosopis alba]XP_028791726.1 ATG8-interacting protein 1-like [Prosopis alba]XP_028791727.1 ATG8-interacting protein 1-like [Prosopis alba]